MISTCKVTPSNPRLSRQTQHTKKHKKRCLHAQISLDACPASITSISLSFLPRAFHPKFIVDNPAILFNKGMTSVPKNLTSIITGYANHQSNRGDLFPKLQHNAPLSVQSSHTNAKSFVSLPFDAEMSAIWFLGGLITIVFFKLYMKNQNSVDKWGKAFLLKSRIVSHHIQVEALIALTRQVSFRMMSQSYERAQFVEHCCTYQDGTPAHVPPGECVAGIPPRFQKAYPQEAFHAWKRTIQWRKQVGLWKIFKEEQVWASEIKRTCPHFIHGKNKQDDIVVYVKPSWHQLDDAVRKGVGNKDFHRFWSLWMEYVAHCVAGSSNDSQGIMVVADLKDETLSHLVDDAMLMCMGQLSKVIQHYPGLFKSVVLVNCPIWIGKVLPTLCLLAQLQKVELHCYQGQRSLRHFINHSEIPLEYGGTNKQPVGTSDSEHILLNIIDKVSRTMLRPDTPSLLMSDSLSESNTYDESEISERNNYGNSLDTKRNSPATTLKSRWSMWKTTPHNRKARTSIRRKLSKVGAHMRLKRRKSTVQ
jgi:hypothetical protein